MLKVICTKLHLQNSGNGRIWLGGRGGGRIVGGGKAAGGIDGANSAKVNGDQAGAQLTTSATLVSNAGVPTTTTNGGESTNGRRRSSLLEAVKSFTPTCVKDPEVGDEGVSPTSPPATQTTPLVVDSTPITA